MTKQEAYRLRKPWVRYVEYARRRCGAKAGKWYRLYAGRGIRCEIAIADTAYLWRRDNAAALASPSLDRIDSDWNYTLANCRFIELSANQSAGGLKRAERMALGLTA